MKDYRKAFLFLSLFLLVGSGCTASRSQQRSHDKSFPYQDPEPDWIRNGEPIIFEDQQWYPVDGTESLLDSEVLALGEYRGVQIFIDREDVRPTDRLYTKFGKNKFRYFKMTPKKLRSGL